MSDFASPVVRPKIADSAFIAPGAVVMGHVTLGAEASIWYGCVVRGDVAAIEIGPQSNIQDLTMVHVDADAPCRIGARVSVGHRVILHGCTVDDECLIGMGSVLLSGCVIGRGSVVGAGALIPEGTIIPPESVVLGVPGKVVRRVDAALAERISHTWANYVRQAAVHRSGRYPVHPPTGQ